MHRHIRKQIDLQVPVSRTWRALTDSREFGAWFGVKLDNPFSVGQLASGRLTDAGNEHIKFEAIVTQISPEHHFSYTWHPYSIDPNVDYSKEHPTLVEFKLEKTATGCRLEVSETGFDKIPVLRRDEAFKMHEQGWAEQMKRIAKYLSTHQ